MHQLRQLRAVLARDHRDAQRRARATAHRLRITAVALALLVLLGLAACYETRASRLQARSFTGQASFTSRLPLQILNLLGPTLEALSADTSAAVRRLEPFDSPRCAIPAERAPHYTSC